MHMDVLKIRYIYCTYIYIHYIKSFDKRKWQCIDAAFPCIPAMTGSDSAWKITVCVQDVERVVCGASCWCIAV